jgi:hypothetical protein
MQTPNCQPVVAVEKRPIPQSDVTVAWALQNMHFILSGLVIATRAYSTRSRQAPPICSHTHMLTIQPVGTHAELCNDLDLVPPVKVVGEAFFGIMSCLWGKPFLVLDKFKIKALIIWYTPYLVELIACPGLMPFCISLCYAHIDINGVQTIYLHRATKIA